MSKINLKLIIMIVVTILIICCSISIFAADPITVTNQGNNVVATNNVVNNVNAVNAVNGTLVSSTNNQVSKYNNTNGALPKTGENDIYVITALLVVFGITAIYTYKKVKDYNM